MYVYIYTHTLYMHHQPVASCRQLLHCIHVHNMHVYIYIHTHIIQASPTCCILYTTFSIVYIYIICMYIYTYTHIIQASPTCCILYTTFSIAALSFENKILLTPSRHKRNALPAGVLAAIHLLYSCSKSG
jgi:hypothetical protein